MALSPINQLRVLLNPTKTDTRGQVTKIAGGTMLIATDKAVIQVPYISGYRIGQSVLVDTNDKLIGKVPGSANVPTYIV